MPPLPAPPNRIALTVPPALRFVTPEKALASTMEEGLPLAAEVVRSARVMPLRPSDMPSVAESEVSVRVNPAFLVARTMPVVGVAQRADSRPTADRERLAGSGGSEVGGS